MTNTLARITAETAIKRKVSRHKLELVCCEIAKCGSVIEACRQIGIAPSNVYTDMRANPAIKEQVELAMAQANGSLERSVYLRAKYGARQRLSDGEVRVLPPSDKLAIEWLRAHNPDVWGQRKTVEMQGSLRVTHAVEMTDDQLARIAAQAEPNVINATEPLQETNKIK